MSKRGKKYQAARAKVDRAEHYPVDEALRLIKESAWTKFDETVDLALNLGVNPKYSDQMVRGAAVLPAGTGKKIRVAVFAKGDKAKEAEASGAEIIGAEDLAEKIEGGFLDFDTVIATPDMMKVVSRLGKILGRRGLMPNPKVGTVTMDVGRAVQDARKGKVEFRVEKEGILHVQVGKASFQPEQLKQNLTAVMDAIMKAKPAAAKGTYIKKATISNTMGPGIRINVEDLVALAAV